MAIATVAGYDTADDEQLGVVSSDPSPLSVQQERQVTGCPSTDLIDPCTCAVSSYTGKVDIVCAGKTIGDDRMKSIISNIPATTPIGKLVLSNTSLTQVPPGLTNLTKISELLLAANQITAIRSGELKLTGMTAVLITLDLSGNTQLETIEKDSLPRKSINNQCKHAYYIIYTLIIHLILINAVSFIFPIY